jgi:D-cysteine desulfhydrase
MLPAFSSPAQAHSVNSVSMKTPGRIPLAHLPTPIHKLERLSAEVGREIFLWRDDMTGFVESGNKVRKLEFLLADALEQGATRIITIGAMQSNHTRATAFCARRLGLEVTILVREPKRGRDTGEPACGNLLLNELSGADLKFITYADYQKAGLTSQPFLEAEAEGARQRGENPYTIPAGGSVPVGCWGYLRAVEEMLGTWAALGLGTRAPDALFFAVGSGGTHAGLHLGYELNGLSTRSLWAVNVSDNAGYFRNRVGELIADTASEFDIDCADPAVQVLDGHVGEGYALASDDDLRFYAKLARQEGVLLDPAYCGKAFRGMLAELRETPDRFGSRILFLHSGGGFALEAYRHQFARLSDSRSVPGATSSPE